MQPNIQEVNQENTTNQPNANLERIISSLATSAQVTNENARERISTINVFFKNLIESGYYFDEKNANQTISIINYLFRGDETCFENPAIDREEYTQLRLHLTTDISSLLGRRGRPEVMNINRLADADRKYLFAHSLKEFLTNNLGAEENAVFTNEEKILIAEAIDSGLEVLAIEPNFIDNMQNYFQNIQERYPAPNLDEAVFNLTRDVRNAVNYARENPLTALSFSLSIGASVAWGVQEGFPIETSSHPERNPDWMLYGLVNYAAISGLIDVGRTATSELIDVASGNNPVGRRLFQFAAVGLGIYLANEYGENSNEAEQAFNMFGSAMAGLSAVASINDLANNLTRNFTQSVDFADLIRNQFNNILGPGNRIVPVAAATVETHDMDREIGQ